MKIGAVILSAGLSRRMGRFKPLLPIGGVPALERCVQTFQSAGINDIRVVTGHRHEEVARVCTALQIHWTHNAYYAHDMFCSVQAGVANLPHDIDGFFVMPVDICLVRPWTIRATSAVFQTHAPLVAYPCFQGRRGHPPLISARLRDSIVYGANHAGGLRRFLERFESKIAEAATFDRNTLLDMDHPKDVARMSDRARRMSRLDREEALALMTRVAMVPEANLVHGLMVAQIAEALALALNRAGWNIDPEFTYSCGLVHDIAKGQPGHEEAGGAFMKKLGLDDMSAVVAAHRDPGTTPDMPVCEREVVYIADKMVQGDKVVTIQSRFQAKRERYAGDANALAAIQSRRETAMFIKAKMENTLGYPLEQVIPALDPTAKPPS